MKYTFCTLGLVIALLFGVVQSIFGQSVSSLEAEKVALSFMKTQNPQAQIIASHNELTNTENTSGTLIYVFNFQSGGFVLVAGDKKSTPILGFSTKNTFDVGNLNPEVTYFLGEMKDQISALKADKKMKAKQAVWDDYLNNKGGYGAETETIVGPYLTTKWDQTQFYNQLCPVDNMGPGGHALTGCVATAMAQVIKYYNSPAFGKGHYGYTHATYGWQFADFENTQYNWNNMPDLLIAENEDVATLMYHCGVAVHMNYGPNVSTVSSGHIIPALQNYFSFSGNMNTIAYNSNPTAFTPNIISELASTRPVIMIGCSNQGCHAWVCDGYKMITNMPPFFHMNWGWGGTQDDYFQLGNFNSFNSNISAIIGIEPSCPRNASLTNPILAGTPFEVIETITVSAPAIPWIPLFGKNVSYDAGKSIEMNPGFLANGNTVILKAFIQGCGGTPQLSNDEVEDRSEEPEVVTELGMDIRIYPNPFSESTTITYELPAAQSIDIKIFNAMGDLVDQTVHQEQQEPGKHEYTFEANDLPNGVYFLVMQTEGKKLSKKLVVAR